MELRPRSRKVLDQVRDRTAIIIAHRLSTVRHVDRIIVLRDGQMIAEGNQVSLLGTSGHYAELYNTSFRHQPPEHVQRARACAAVPIGRRSRARVSTCRKARSAEKSVEGAFASKRLGICCERYITSPAESARKRKRERG